MVSSKKATPNFRIAGDMPGNGARELAFQSEAPCADASRRLGMDYGLRSAPTIATEITHFSDDRLCQAWRVPF